MVPVHVLWSARKIVSSAGEVDEAPGVYKEVRVTQDLDGRVWEQSNIKLIDRLELDSL